MEGFTEMEADRSCVLLRGQNESLVNNTQPFIHRRGELREAYQVAIDYNLENGEVKKRLKRKKSLSKDFDKVLFQHSQM